MSTQPVTKIKDSPPSTFEAPVAMPGPGPQEGPAQQLQAEASSPRTAAAQKNPTSDPWIAWRAGGHLVLPENPAPVASPTRQIASAPSAESTIGSLAPPPNFLVKVQRQPLLPLMA